jgi:molybdenum cofactor cytidylyltransferase
VIFGEFPLAQCEGLLLAHSLRLPGGAMKKGRCLTVADCEALIGAGRIHVGYLLADVSQDTDYKIRALAPTSIN